MAGEKERYIDTIALFYARLRLLMLVCERPRLERLRLGTPQPVTGVSPQWFFVVTIVRVIVHGRKTIAFFLLFRVQ